MEGTVVDQKYQVVTCLGQGGMGAVFEARHLGTGRRVALKMIMPSALAAGGDVVERFRREARASGAIDSEHVVQVLDSGVDPRTSSPYLVMEYLSGEDLQTLVKRVGPLDPDVVLRIAAQACAGLVRAHDLGIVHRDIKSANVFASRREGGDVTIKVLDFGIAKVRADPLSASANQGITATGALLGSPLYMSPEQVLGSRDIDARSDVYSLGVTMYEALSGAAPYHEQETVGMLVVAITGGKIPPIQDRAPWVSRDVAAIVHRALAVEPQARYASTAEMLRAISAVLKDGSAIRESMLVGVSADKKGIVSSKLLQRTARIPTPVPPPPPRTASTNTAFVDSAETIPKRPAVHVLLPIGLLVVAAGAGVGILARQSMTRGAQEAPSGAALVPSGQASPSATTSASAIAYTSATASATASASAATTASATPTATATMRTTATIATPTPKPSASAAPKPNCDPPYTFGADGRKIWKRECL